MFALAASASSLGNSFAYDDVAIVANDWRIHRLVAPWQFFTREYWSHFALYRPLTSLAFAVEWRLGHGAPLGYHLVNVLLYLLICLQVYQLAVRLLGKWPGWWAAALFAVHPVHVEAVGNAVGQSELWAAACVLGAVNYYISVRERLRYRDIAILSALYAAGCLFKEHAVLLPGLLIAAELTVFRGSLAGTVRRRETTWLYVSLMMVCIAYLVTRSQVTGSFVGERAAAALAGLDLRERILTMLGVVPEWARLLIAPIHLQADYMPQEIPIARSVGARQVPGALLLVSFIGLAWKTRHRQPALTFAACWMAITLLPVSNLVVPTGILLAERTLFLPSVGLALAAGVGCSWIISRVGSRARLRGVLVGTGAVLLFAGAVRSVVRQPVWRDSETLFASLLVDAPRSYRTHWAHAHTLAASGDRAGAERAYRTALELFQDDPRLLAEMGDRYSTMKRCSDAMPLYQRSLALAGDTLFDRTRFNRCLISPPSPPL